MPDAAEPQTGCGPDRLESAQPVFDLGWVSLLEEQVWSSACSAQGEAGETTSRAHGGRNRFLSAYRTRPAVDLVESFCITDARCVSIVLTLRLRTLLISLLLCSSQM